MNIEIITTQINTCEAMIDSIQKMGHEVKLSVCVNIQDLDEVVKRVPDLVVLAQKYISNENEENIWLSEYFATNNINYSGSSRETLKYGFDKILAKAHLKEQGYNTANYFTAIPGEYINDNKIPIRYPLFLKPSGEDNGDGIDDLSLVTTYAQFESKVQSLYTLYNKPVLVEEYLDGPEFKVSLIQQNNGDLLVSAMEVIPPKSQNGARILGSKTQLEKKEELINSASNDIIARVKNLAVDAFMDLGVRDFAQIDIKTNKYGHCFFMEANLHPSLKDNSSYLPKACEIEHGLSYDNVIKLIVDEGISRVAAS